ncbi:MAG: DUF58 domain-containing protein [Pseudomonadota bacterium]|nr:DUF58 domain-containing protein [Pseudomonadota bacterium]
MSLKARIRRWIQRRSPPQREAELTHRNVYIFPSGLGWVFAVLVFAMLLTAINYQNSLIYGLTFWLVAVGLGAIWLTFQNLSGLHLQAMPAQSGFVGDELTLPVTLSAPGGRGLFRRQARSPWKVSLWLGYPDSPMFDCTLAPGEQVTLPLIRQVHRRGPLTVRRMKVMTRYPFGLLTAWSWVALDYPVVIWPTPEASPVKFAGGDTPESDGENQVRQGSDELVGIRDYVKGDPMQRIAWKHSARGTGLKSREGEETLVNECWLDWDQLAGLETETRLSRLTSWVLSAEAQGWLYGLRIPGQIIAPAQGRAHRDQCLDTLALWGLSPAQTSGQIDVQTPPKMTGDRTTVDRTTGERTSETGGVVN